MKLHYRTKGPFEISFPDKKNEDWDTSKGVKIIGFVHAPDLPQASFACFVSRDRDGEVLDYLRVQPNARMQTEILIGLKKMLIYLRFKSFIRQKKPHVFVIGGESRNAQMIQEYLRGVVAELVTENGLPNIPVEVYI